MQEKNHPILVSIAIFPVSTDAIRRRIADCTSPADRVGGTVLDALAKPPSPDGFVKQAS